MKTAISTSTSLPKTIILAGTTYQKKTLLPTCSTGGHPITSKFYFSDGETNRCFAHPPAEVPLPQDGETVDGVNALIDDYKLMGDKAIECFFTEVVPDINDKQTSHREDELLLQMKGRHQDAAIAKSLTWLIESKDWHAFIKKEVEEEGDDDAAYTSEELRELSVSFKEDAKSDLKDWRKKRHTLPGRSGNIVFGEMDCELQQQVGAMLGLGLNEEVENFGDWDLFENPRWEDYQTGTCAKPSCPTAAKTFKETETSTCCTDGRKDFHSDCILRSDVEAGLHDMNVKDMEVLCGDEEENEDDAGIRALD